MLKNDDLPENILIFAMFSLISEGVCFYL